MPKGVDHFTSRWVRKNRLMVQKSLMPKGVDHCDHSGMTTGEAVVQKSLMPKGVDHDLTKREGGEKGSAKIFDAERR